MCCRSNYQRRFFVHLIAILNYRETPTGKLKCPCFFFFSYSLPFFSSHSRLRVVPSICLNNMLIATRGPVGIHSQGVCVSRSLYASSPCFSNCVIPESYVLQIERGEFCIGLLILKGHETQEDNFVSEKNAVTFVRAAT